MAIKELGGGLKEDDSLSGDDIPTLEEMVQAAQELIKEDPFDPDAADDDAANIQESPEGNTPDEPADEED